MFTLLWSLLIKICLGRGGGGGGGGGVGTPFYNPPWYLPHQRQGFCAVLV